LIEYFLRYFNGLLIIDTVRADIIFVAKKLKAVKLTMTFSLVQKLKFSKS
jgi:hypothetical protein